jgi:hypothetical protein
VSQLWTTGLRCSLQVAESVTTKGKPIKPHGQVGGSFSILRLFSEIDLCIFSLILGHRIRGPATDLGLSVQNVLEYPQSQHQRSHKDVFMLATPFFLTVDQHINHHGYRSLQGQDTKLRRRQGRLKILRFKSLNVMAEVYPR